jgi:hypothetical protein
MFENFLFHLSWFFARLLGVGGVPAISDAPPSTASSHPHWFKVPRLDQYKTHVSVQEFGEE